MTGNKIILEDLVQIITSKVNWQRFSGKTLLITGANGMLPSYMVETILYLCHIGIIENAKVLALVRNEVKAKQRFKYYLNDSNLEIIVQDVCLPLNIKFKIDFIVHAASQASPKYYDQDPVGTIKANTLGTINLLELAVKNPVESFLFFSSSEVYGLVENGSATKEDNYGFLDPLNIRSFYAESKRMGETICASWFHQYKVPVKIARPFHTFGPGLDLNDGRVYADFISDIIHNRDIVLKSEGTTKRAYCYLSDATVAFFLVLLNGINSEAYNIGNPACEFSVFELAQTLVNLFPEKKLEIKKSVANSGTNNSLFPYISPDISKIKGLGWQPKIKASEGFYRTIQSYEQFI